AASYNPNHITAQQYFSPNIGTQIHLDDIGRPKAMITKVKTFKARLWICRDYPLSLKDQIIPIIDLMSEYNPYFHKLKEFLTKQLPNGFPLKVGKLFEILTENAYYCYYYCFISLLFLIFTII
ncbi:unnamed protein product, partial [Schistosoma curassoni]|uniref:DUF4485 domain-containing protein n=1 Tax=Schistosoma curassoni TaxID=6186 RepID=A0A183JSC7_9TREM